MLFSSNFSLFFFSFHINPKLQRLAPRSSAAIRYTSFINEKDSSIIYIFFRALTRKLISRQNSSKMSPQTRAVNTFHNINGKYLSYFTRKYASCLTNTLNYTFHSGLQFSIHFSPSVSTLGSTRYSGLAPNHHRAFTSPGFIICNTLLCQPLYIFLPCVLYRIPFSQPPSTFLSYVLYLFVICPIILCVFVYTSCWTIDKYIFITKEHY